MAANLLQIRPVCVRACVMPEHRKPDTAGKKTSSSNWWSPIFGWTSEPGYYIDSVEKDDSSGKTVSNPDLVSARPPHRARGCLTEEKAKQLRMMTVNADSFHDAMYHSAIASRLASDFSGHYDA